MDGGTKSDLGNGRKNGCKHEQQALHNQSHARQPLPPQVRVGGAAAGNGRLHGEKNGAAFQQHSAQWISLGLFFSSHLKFLALGAPAQQAPAELRLQPQQQARCIHRLRSSSPCAAQLSLGRQAVSISSRLAPSPAPTRRLPSSNTAASAAAILLPAARGAPCTAPLAPAPPRAARCAAPLPVRRLTSSASSSVGSACGQYARGEWCGGEVDGPGRTLQLVDVEEQPAAPAVWSAPSRLPRVRKAPHGPTKYAKTRAKSMETTTWPSSRAAHLVKSARLLELRTQRSGHGVLIKIPKPRGQLLLRRSALLRRGRAVLRTCAQAGAGRSAGS